MPELIVSGTVENQGRFYGSFDHIVLLHAPLKCSSTENSERTDNPYGKTAAQRADIARYTEEVVPLLRRSATVELDARRPTRRARRTPWRFCCGVSPGQTASSGPCLPNR